MTSNKVTTSAAGGDGAEDEKKKPQAAPFLALFRFADTFDLCLVGFGLLMAIVAGATQPLLIIVFGDLTGASATTATDSLSEIMEPLVLNMVWLAVAALASWGIAFYCVPVAADRQAHRLRAAFHAHVLKQDAAFFDASRPGEFAVMINDTVNQIRNALAGKLVEAFQAGAQFIVGFVVAFIYSWELTLVLLAMVPLIGIATQFTVQAGVAGETVLGLEEYNAAGAIASEAVGSIRTVASVGGEPRVVDRFRDRLQGAQRAAIKAGTKIALTTSLMFAIMFFMYGAGFWYGGKLIADSRTGAIRDYPPPEGLLDLAGELADNPFAAHAAMVQQVCIEGLGLELSEDISDIEAVASCACDYPWQALGGEYEANDPNCGCGHGRVTADIKFEVGSKCFSVSSILTAFFALLIGGFGMGQIGPAIISFSKGRVAAAQLFAILDRKPTIDVDAPGKKSLGKRASGRVAFEGVGFSYRTADGAAEGETVQRKVFSDLSFEIEAGQTVAFVGESGCGKSTIARLLARFYDVDAGRVTVDGVDLRELAVKELRDNQALVAQEPLLFDTSIALNIKNGAVDPSAVTHEQVEAAAEAANANRFIKDASRFPQGYDTPVGPRGNKLSGGQKQRVAIARGLLRDAPILILDEATSALDMRSEATVQRAIEARGDRCTTLIIAHRLSTVRRADRIFVLGRTDDNLEGSAIVESGTHDELMARKGSYFALIGGQQADPNASAASLSSMTEEADADRVPASSAPSTFSLAADVEEEEDKDEQKTAMEEHKVVTSRVWSYARGHEVLVLLGVLSSIANGLVFPLIAIFFSEMLQAFTLYDDADLRFEVQKWSIAMFIVAVAGYFFNAGQIGFMSSVGERLTTKVRMDLFKAILRQDITFFDKPTNSVGALMSQLSGDTALVQYTTGQQLGAMLNSLSAMIFGIVIAFIANWKLALVVLAATPLLGAAQAAQLQLITAGEKGVSEELRESVGDFTECVMGIREMHAFRLYEAAAASYERLMRAPLRVAIKSDFATAFAMGMSQFITFGFYALTFWYGGKLIDDGELDFYNFMKGLFVLAFAASGAGNATTFMGDQAKAQVAVSRVFWLMDRQPPIDTNPWGEDGDERAVQADAPKGEVELKGVSFAYPMRAEATVFGGIDLKVEAGQTVALVGVSGSGKSTIVQLLERFYDPVAATRLGDAGTITLDGVDLKDLDVKWLRSHVGLVGQEPRLFDGTVHDNIAMGKAGATREDVIAAAKVAHAHDFITAMKDGYDAQVGAGGGRLSGGQKQRVAIARAIVKQPRILLLDEATSALDNESEKLVQAQLDALVADKSAHRTTIVIAHRLSTVRNADRIFVFDTDGGMGSRVVEAGTHNELMAQGGLYSRLSAAFDGGVSK